MTSSARSSSTEEPLSAQAVTGSDAPAASTPVAYIMSRFPKLTETFILREMIELERQGQPVTIFPLLREREPVRHAEAEGLLPAVCCAPFLSPAIVLANLRALWRSPLRYLKTWRLALRGTWGSANLFIGAVGIFPKSVYFARLIEERGIRHIHAHYATHPALAALIISELAGISFSFTAHAHDIFVDTRMLCAKVQRARFVVTISEFNKRHLLRLCPALPAEKLHVVRCGVDPGRYAPARETRMTDRVTLLCVASLQPYKGLDYLIRACARLKATLGRFRCLIVGEGEERTRLERLIVESGLQDVVELLGAQSQDAVGGLLQQADLFVLPSIVAADGQMEGIPVALMEAMASGLPVVATRLSGIPELVEDGVSGLLVPPKDERALAQAITRLCQDAELRREMGRRGREHVAAGFDLATNVAALRVLFHAAQVTAARRADFRGSSAAVLSALTGRLRACLVSNGRADASLGKRIGGYDSQVYEVTARNGQRDATRLILKLHRPAWAGPEDGVEQGRRYAQREYEALSRLSREFVTRGVDGLTVPKPVAFFPESAALLMESCEGTRFDRALRWATLPAFSSQRARLCRHAGACGEWLGLFHRITERDGDAAETYRRIEREFYQALDACRAIGLGHALANRVSQAFEEGGRAAFTGEHRIVGRHGDFGPHNAFLSAHRVTVVDFEGLQDGIGNEDVGSFLGVIEVMPRYHLSRPLAHLIQQRFLDGYARRYQPVNRAQLEVFTLAAVVQMMAHNPRLRDPARRRLDRWKRRARLARYTAWFQEQVTLMTAGLTR